MSLHADLEMVLEEIESNRQEAKLLTRGLTDAQFNWKPAPVTWSMAENLTHLSTVIRLDLSEISRAVGDAKSRKLFSPGPFRYGFVSRWFVRSMEPPPKRRFKAPAIYVPQPEKTLDLATREFLEVLDKLTDLLRESNGLDLVRIKIVSPVSKLVRMPLGARFQLMTAHNRRHLWQALQVKQHSGFPAA